MDRAVECRRSRNKTAWVKTPTYGSIDICLIQETKRLARNTTPSFPGFAVIRTDRSTNQRGAGRLTLIRVNPEIQKTVEGRQLDRLTVKVQRPCRK